MDMIDILLAKAMAVGASKAYTDATIAPLLGGVHYRGSVNYFNDLPSNPQEGDAYTVKYSGTSGTTPDGTEYVWALDNDDSTYKWIGFSPDTYTKSEIDNLLSAKQNTLTFDGTYDASTNKAATVSTVSNAIEALDVTGDSNISAGKTIKSWSESDGKISVTTQDIAITGSQAVLTGYAKAGSKQAISASDTATVAIGKLEQRVETNETNISKDTAALVELVDSGAKNLLNTYSINDGERYGITYTINADGSISTTAGTTTQNSNLTVNLTLPAGTYYLCGCPDGGTSEEPYNYNATVLITAGGILCRVYNSTMVSSFTLTETTEVTWRFRVYSGKSIAATTFYPMICTKAAWDISHEYVPYRPSEDEQNAQIETNKNNISSIQQTIGDINSVLEEVL